MKMLLPTKPRVTLDAGSIVRGKRPTGAFPHPSNLPPYSPDLNPIEMAFSKLKAHLRGIDAQTLTDMFHALS